MEREHTYLRALLEDLRLELGVLFEHGLGGLGLGNGLSGCADRLETAGMARGAELCRALAAELKREGLDTAWTPEAALAAYTRLWRYAGLCLRRLEYLEAEAALEQPDAPVDAVSRNEPPEEGKE